MGTGSTERPRLFVALELPVAATAQLAHWWAAVDPQIGWRAVAPETWHLTLCFLGERPLAELAAIADACGVVAGARAPTLSLGEMLLLPPRRPRVLAVRLHDRQGTLAALQRRVAEALRSGDWYQPERRPFLAHVTVARVRSGGDRRAAGFPPAAPEPIAFVARRVALMRSHLGARAPARYERLAAWELDAASSAPAGRSHRASTATAAVSRSTSPAPDRSRR